MDSVIWINRGIFMKEIFDIFFRGSEIALLEDVKENWIMILLVVIGFAAVIAACVFFLRKRRNNNVTIEKKGDSVKKKQLFDVRSLSFAAMCLAVAFVLSFIKILNLPQGGGITPVSMLPIIIYAYIYGAKRGFVVSFVYFLLQLLQGVYFLNVVQFFFDYMFAFTIIGIAGFFQKNIVLGVISSHLLRYVSHVIAAFAFFREFNQTGINDTVYCLVYNSFILIEMVACIIIVLIPPIKKNINRMKYKLAR